jgi:hypothetical protein
VSSILPNGTRMQYGTVSILYSKKLALAHVFSVLTHAPDVPESRADAYVTVDLSMIERIILCPCMALAISLVR